MTVNVGELDSRPGYISLTTVLVPVVGSNFQSSIPRVAVAPAKMREPLYSIGAEADD